MTSRGDDNGVAASGLTDQIEPEQRRDPVDAEDAERK